MRLSPTLACAAVLLGACSSDSSGGGATPMTSGAGGTAGVEADAAMIMQGAGATPGSGSASDASDAGNLAPMDAMVARDAGRERDAAGDAEAPPFSVRPWPTDDPVTELDLSGAFGTDVSGLTYEPAGPGAGIVWAAMNLAPSKLYKIEKAGAVWQRSVVDDWGNGKELRFPDGQGVPDAEGVTRAAPGSDIIYVGSERDLQGGAASTSRLSVLSYDTSAGGGTLTALREWDLTASLPAASANQGIEAVTWIPDSALSSLADEASDSVYDPNRYPEHGGGVFVVGIEGQSGLFFFVLDDGGGSTLLGTAQTDLSGVMGLEYDRDVGYLWAYCDDTCGNRAVILTLSGNHFEKRAELMRPPSLPNINNEGIAIAPESDCAGGRKPFYWVEDGNTNGHVLRAGTIPCGAFL